MWNLPGPGIEPMSLALAGRFLSTAPPRKSISIISFVHISQNLILFSVWKPKLHKKILKDIGTKRNTFCVFWKSTECIKFLGDTSHHRMHIFIRTGESSLDWWEKRQVFLQEKTSINNQLEKILQTNWMWQRGEGAGLVRQRVIKGFRRQERGWRGAWERHLRGLSWSLSSQEVKFQTDLLDCPLSGQVPGDQIQQGDHKD